jgi:hypothetical protein
VIVVIVESVAMSEHDADTPEQVLKFVPKERPRSYGPLVEEAGEAIIAKIQKAAELSNENCDRSMKLAHKLSMQLNWRPRPNSSETGRPAPKVGFKQSRKRSRRSSSLRDQCLALNKRRSVRLA